MTHNRKVDLYVLLKSLQSQLATGLQVREVVDHPEAKGTASELDWKGMLSQFLPLRYQVSKAFVIDSVGERSDQVDIVVHDRQYSPLLFEHSGATYIPAESVYAVFEVKQTVGSGEILYAGRKAGSVRRLKRTSSPIEHAGGRFRAKAPFRILAGVVALDVKWKSEVGTRLKGCLTGLLDDERLDLGCIVRSGGFEARYRRPGSCLLEMSEPDVALGYFQLRLLSRLQKLGTVPAIDVDAYSESMFATAKGKLIRQSDES